MLSDRQSIILCAVVVVGFVVFGILNILDRFYIAIPIVGLFLIIIINLIITKRDPENQEMENKIDKD